MRRTYLISWRDLLCFLSAAAGEWKRTRWLTRILQHITYRPRNPRRHGPDAGCGHWKIGCSSVERLNLIRTFQRSRKTECGISVTMSMWDTDQVIEDGDRP